MQRQLSPLFTVLLCLTLLATPMFPTASFAAEKDKHCIVYIEPIQAGEESSKTAEGPCFDDLADAVAKATKDKVRLPKGSKAEDISKALKQQKSDPEANIQAAGGYVIGIDWTAINRGGSSYLWTASTPCAYTNGYYSFYDYPVMPSGWNDVISSAEGYAGCTKFYHYENGYYGRAVIDCGTYCAYIGAAMNDKTSSVRMRPF